MWRGFSHSRPGGVTESDKQAEFDELGVVANAIIVLSAFWNGEMQQWDPGMAFRRVLTGNHTRRGRPRMICEWPMDNGRVFYDERIGDAE